jgi:hypothetical protein
MPANCCKKPQRLAQQRNAPAPSSAEAERDRYRDALIACRESVWRSLDRFRMMPPTDESRQLSALLDTIDAAAKGQG